MIHILGILFSTLGSGVLCAGMAKHQSRLVGRKLPPSTVRLMKFGGFVVLALALAIDASGLGAAYGLIAWFGHLTRSEEHTSELQSLMRTSYAVFCLKTKKIRCNIDHATR